MITEKEDKTQFHETNPDSSAETMKGNDVLDVVFSTLSNNLLRISQTKPKVFRFSLTVHQMASKYCVQNLSGRVISGYPDQI
jgi:hypothetical protein